MTTFDWAGLWRKTADVFKKHGENIAATTIDDMDRAAANYLRTRIEAAFVPVEQRDKAEALLFQRTNEYIIATARAEAAEAEVRRLRDTPNHIWAEARDTEWDAGFNHAVALFRQALGDNHE